MTEAKLLKKIKNKDTIYVVDRDRECVYDINLGYKHYTIISYLNFKTLDSSLNGSYWYGSPCLDNIYETKEDAIWNLEFNKIKRIDTLNIPCWKEFQKRKTELLDFPTFNFFGADHIEYRLLGRKKENYIEIIKFGLRELPLFKSTYSKENYEKACKIVKKLFEGEII